MKLRYIASRERTQEGIVAILKEYFEDAAATVSSSSTVFTFLNGLTISVLTASLSSVYAIAVNSHGAVFFSAGNPITNWFNLWVSTTEDELSETKLSSWPSHRNQNTIAYKEQARILLAPIVYGYNGYMKDVFDTTKNGSVGTVIEVDGEKYMYVGNAQVIKISKVINAPEQEVETE